MSKKLDYWDQAEEYAAEGGGGGVIGKARIDLGYFVMIKGLAGLEREECAFVYEGNNEEKRKKVLQAAQAFAVKHGKKLNAAQWAVITRLYKADCYREGERVTWTYDKLEGVPLFPTKAPDKATGEILPSAASAIMAAIRQHDAPSGKDFYGRFGWQDNPHFVRQGEAGMKSKDQNQNPKFPDFCLLLEVYQNEEAAMEALKEQMESSGSTSTKYGDEFPGSGWDGHDWAKEAADIEMALVDGMGIKELLDEEYGEDTTWLCRALEAGGKSQAEIIELTGLKRGKVKRALSV